jgi:hypothetical protein
LNTIEVKWDSCMKSLRFYNFIVSSIGWDGSSFSTYVHIYWKHVSYKICICDNSDELESANRCWGCRVCFFFTFTNMPFIIPCIFTGTVLLSPI